MTTKHLLTSLLLITLLTLIQCAQKKGVAITNCCGVPFTCDDMPNLGADWYWNWFPEPYQCNRAEPEFFSNIWGPSELSYLSRIPSSVNTVLGFNEPNFAKPWGSGVAPEIAAASWPQFEATGKSLVSPGVSTCLPGGACT
eukprot:TRINITY_DN10692_c0_g1_i1.p2 TRINITY_DN10692_c0_g1~~TRINITY_DN10692_c0_g1_i1.p2  ORF type:complete len:141 (-),score=14.80 TRINITY_DN10692_c0_g1_i1:406-828(-)